MVIVLLIFGVGNGGVVIMFFFWDLIVKVISVWIEYVVLGLRLYDLILIGIFIWG